MAKAIEVRYCRKCGKMEQMSTTMDYRMDQLVAVVWCPCSEADARVTKLGAQEAYYLDVEVKQEASGNDGDDQGDVLAQHEQEAEGAQAAAD